MEDPFLFCAYRILAVIGGAGVLAGFFCELFNSWNRKNNPHIEAREKAQYLEALIKSYEEAYRTPVASFCLSLSTIQQKESPK